MPFAVLKNYVNLFNSQFFEDNLGKPVPQCRTILEFAAARDNRGGSGANQISTRHAKRMHKAPVRLPPSDYKYTTFYRLDVLPNNCIKVLKAD